MELEPNEQILELKAKIQGLNVIIQEAKECQAFKEHGFYPIINRTLKALKSSYEQDAHKAVKSTLSNVGNFLGRMEMINDYYDILDKFAINADQAQLEIDACTEQIKELEQQINDESKTEQITDIGGGLG